MARLLAGWKPDPAADQVFAVWLENGRRVEDDPSRLKIGKGEDISSAEEQARRVLQEIHQSFGYVRGVCFSNQGKGKR